MEAAHYNHLEMVKLLIEKGAQVNAKDNSGQFGPVVGSSTMIA